MKESKKPSVFRHALVMVGRTWKSYALLSVTIVLSFALLLGYLLYTDSALYNRYKLTFSYLDGEVAVASWGQDGERLNRFLQQAEHIGETDSFLMYWISDTQLDERFQLSETEPMPDGGSIRLDLWELVFLPDYCWLSNYWFFDLSDTIIWTDGSQRDGIRLDMNECLLPEDLYFALGIDQMEGGVHTFKFDGLPAITLKVAGYVKEKAGFAFEIDPETGEQTGNYSNTLLLSSKLLTGDSGWEVEDSDIYRTVAFLYTDSPDAVVELAETMGFYDIYDMHDFQTSARTRIIAAKETKAMIACALLLLLGINLYSSFTNALNDRKFEIGVKRAIGASAWSIVRQFLYESLLVMTVNTVASVVLVTDVFLVYKYIRDNTPDEYGVYSTWTLYITPHSIAMFLVCALSLTIVFSLIFAYKSTRVEIVQYLKAE